MDKKIFYSIFLLIILLFNINHYVAAETAEMRKHTEDIEVIDYCLPGGIYNYGDEVPANIEIKNLAEDRSKYYLGYSLRDEKGNYYDVSADFFELDRGETAILEQSWQVPSRAMLGNYDLYLSLWDAMPSEQANRLVAIELRNAFKIKKTSSNFYSFSDIELEVASHSLGRGRFKTENVELIDDYLILSSGENSFDGAEVRTTERLGFGSYKVSLKSSYAPGSFTAFFLYQDVESDNDEIDIEIHNDGSQLIDFVTFKDGEKTNFRQESLDFDSTADFYEYRIDYYSERIAFYVEGELLVEYTSDLPTAEMKLMINHWWPNWLEAEKEHDKSRVYIKSIEMR